MRRFGDNDMQLLTMQEVQKNSLEILKKIDEICKDLNLKYSLTYGTLLGAIRHKGFIPWDDDVDIMMPRKDYDIIINYFIEHKEELKPLEVINSQTNPKCPYAISRISDSRYKLDVDNEDDYGLGLFVDIYPIDGVGNSINEYRQIKNKSSIYASLCFVSTRNKVKRENTRSNIKMLIKYPAFIIARILGKEYFLKHLYKIASTCNYDNSQYIGCIVWGSDEGLKDIFPKTWFDEIVEVEFENTNFYAIKEHDKLLKQFYGDYMKIPPVEERIAHHYYDAYKK